MAEPEIPDVIYTPDGRVLLLGMDPTMTLCAECHEVISTDYIIINISMELGRLTHVRCMPELIYEDELLGDNNDV